MTEGNKKKVALHTLGCRLNFSEAGSIAQGFSKRGYDIVPFGEPSDVVFINTCTVTDDADSTCRNIIRKAHRQNPESKIVVAGCYSQMDPNAVAAIQGVDLVLGTSEKYKVFDFLDDEQEQMIKVDQTNEFWGAATTLEDSHTRAFLKIQDGCNYICSFCIIPHARGRSRTIEVLKAAEQAKEITQQGFQEVVLTGVNIGEYARSSGEKLEDLVKAVAKVDGVRRLRMSSVEPNTITASLLQTLKDTGIYQPHFHIPLQSGDDEILKSMRRKYTTSQYRDVMTMIQDYFPGAAIGADMIVGYPGETEEQFQNTYNFATEMPLTHFHVFPYSKRQKTTAASLENHIPHHIKKERVRRLRELGEKKLLEYSKNKIGQEANVLWERERNGDFLGYTENFLRVKTRSEIDLTNQITSVRIIDLEDTNLRVIINQK